MSEEFNEIAEEIFELVGPRENILSVKNSMASLKLNLKDKKKVDVGALQRLEGVGGIIETQDQLQIMIVHKNSKDIIVEFNKIFGTKNRLSKFDDEKKTYDKIIKKIRNYLKHYQEKY